ncbi:MAG: TetR/AcrR family transcriptional regulator [Peptococcaceae bacterium]|nr:TetR/AcrR family transcriptional regulator [Peptococcaceae bacterium]
MSGVRERKKEALRKRIIEAAKDCFLTDGFEETTITTIAERANIGVGTLYNYFPSKALLYIESYFREMGNPQERLDQVIRKHGEDPVLTITKIIDVYLEPYYKFEKNTLLDLLTVSLDGVSKHPELGHLYKTNKFGFVDFLAKILDAYKEKGLFSSDFEPHDAAFCVYSIITTQCLFYIIDESISYHEMQEGITRQIALFFQGKIKQRGVRK